MDYEEYGKINHKVEFARILDNGCIRIPECMWDNIIQQDKSLLWHHDGHLRIESLGNDLYKITKKTD